VEPEVSLQGDNDNNRSTSRIEEAEACQLITVEDEEGSIQPNKDSKRISPVPNIQASTHTKQPNKLVSSEKSKQRKAMLDHARKQKAREDTSNPAGSEKAEIDKDNDNQTQSAKTSHMLKSNIQQNLVEDRTQSPAKLWN
jgi:hypothetical protein